METAIPAVELRSITKRFLDVVANKAVNLSLYSGEICALLGENGAGKTTLMNILFGYYGFDEGRIFVKGEACSFASPRDAIKRGIGMIHQHFTLVSTQTVLENVIIGTGSGLFVDYRASRSRLLELEERFGLQVDPDAFVWSLSVGEQQKVEILKALYRDAEVLIMDEPTAVLSPTETAALFSTLKVFAAEGKAVVFISHKLNEVMEISDRVVVLRNGEVTAEVRTADTDRRALASLMVGRELAQSPKAARRTSSSCALEVSGLCAANNRGLPAVRSLSFKVASGEVLGFAGVSGNGQSELAEVLFGLRPPSAGSVAVLGVPLPPSDPAAVRERGVGRIPEDRMETGLLLDLSVEENLILEDHGTEFGRRGILDFKRIGEFAGQCIREFGIKTDGKDAIAKSLSGGNLQKVILARELAGTRVLVIACQPTRGLDVGATEYVHERIRAAREAGAGVLLISDDLDEVLELSDRVAVMYEGAIAGAGNADELSRERIGLWMSGVK